MYVNLSLTRFKYAIQWSSVLFRSSFVTFLLIVQHLLFLSAPLWYCYKLWIPFVVSRKSRGQMSQQSGDRELGKDQLEIVYIYICQTVFWVHSPAHFINWCTAPDIFTCSAQQQIIKNSFSISLQVPQREKHKEIKKESKKESKTQYITKDKLGKQTRFGCNFRWRFVFCCKSKKQKNKKRKKVATTFHHFGLQTKLSTTTSRCSHENVARSTFPPSPSPHLTLPVARFSDSGNVKLKLQGTEHYSGLNAKTYSSSYCSWLNWR